MLNKLLNLKARTIFLLLTLYIACLILFALYVQYFQGIEPCPLCMLQRVIFIAIGVVALAALLHNPKQLGIKIYSSINIIFSLCGLGLAGRHIWLESLPPEQAPACAPSLDIMLELFPLTEVLKTAIMGSGDCAKVTWSMLGLSFADWAMLCFVFLFFVSGFLLVRKN